MVPSCSWLAVSLAAVGVLVTAGLVGLLAAWVLGARLAGRHAARSDCGLDRCGGLVRLSCARKAPAEKARRLHARIESNGNDPMAVFLTVAILGLLASGKTGLEISAALSFMMQFAIGALLSYRWAASGLAPQPAAADQRPLPAARRGPAALIFAVAAQLGGSGFLAIYLAGAGARVIASAGPADSFWCTTGWLGSARSPCS